MSTIEDGGPAYGFGTRPDPNDPNKVLCGGITKREAFAMAAMQALLSRSDSRSQPLLCNAGYYAADAVAFADALLAALRGDANV